MAKKLTDEQKAENKAKNEAENEAKKVEKTEEVKPIGKPKFINKGNDVKINLGDRNDSKWITVHTGEIVTIPRKIAKANKLQEVK